MGYGGQVAQGGSNRPYMIWHTEIFCYEFRAGDDPPPSLFEDSLGVGSGNRWILHLFDALAWTFPYNGRGRGG